MSREHCFSVRRDGRWISGPGPDDPLSWSQETCRIFGIEESLISGYTGEAMLQRGIVEEGSAVLAKPFSPEALGQRVRETLAAPPAP
jgi:hypothetical protein